MQTSVDFVRYASSRVTSRLLPAVVMLVTTPSELGAAIVHGPEEAMWAPGYYSILFEDPDGIRLEINFVPGKGLLK